MASATAWTALSEDEDEDLEEDTSMSTSDSESVDELTRLKSENLILRERLLHLQDDLIKCKNGLDSCCDTLQAISLLRKPFCQPPPEILLMIFNRAIPPSFIVDASASHTPNSTWCQVLKQKRAIVNVCQTWHKIALPFLYEDICIQNISQLQPLLHTLEDPAIGIKEFVKAVSFNCLVPRWFESQFGQRLKSLFDLCPNITSFSYLSSCQLPSPKSLSVLPSHITHLELVQDVSLELLFNIFDRTSLNIVSLSIHTPHEKLSEAREDQIVSFRQLEELSLSVTSKSISKLNNVSFNWKMPMLTRLTFRIRGKWGDDMTSTPFKKFCRKHANIGLTFLHIHPEYHWSMPNFTLPMQELLDLCPNLEHIVVHPRTPAPLTHQCIKWVDIWESHEISSCKIFWQSIRGSITTSSFPSLQGIRHLSFSVAFLPNIPLLLPPGQVSTPLGSFGISFLGLDIRHDDGEIYRVLLLKEEEEEEEDPDFVVDPRETSDSESDESDGDFGSDAELEKGWDATMDELE